jgi:phosphate-selective porin OprO and OprP
VRAILSTFAWTSFVAVLNASSAAAQVPAGPATLRTNTDARQEQPSADPRSQSVNDTDDAKSNAPSAERDWGFQWSDHPSLFFGKNTRIDFRARLQVDVRDSEASIGDASGFDVARRRVGVEGRIAGVVDFQIEAELGDDDPWRDVYADYRQFPHAQVQAGKFKLPFSLDENTSSTNLDFVYRSRAATQLAPGRDRGAMVHGRVLKSVLRYELGLFDHDGKNARTSNPERVFGGTTVAGRVTVQPFRARKTELRDLQFGVAFTGSEVPAGFASLRGRTALDASFFPSDVWVQGQRRRVGLEARWRPGPFSVKAEYIRVTTERLGQSVEDTDLSPLLATGWYVSGTWAITGEAKADGIDNPRRPIFRGGYGALELAVRVEGLGFGSTAAGDLPSTSPRADVILGNSDRAVTIGVNWHPYHGIKVQLNFVRESISDPAHGPLASEAAFWSRVVRFQFTL